jgi:hypothetical protein
MPHDASKPPIHDAGWASREFAGAELGDRRLVKRLVSLSERFADHPGASIPRACGSWSGAKAAYRFFDNDSVEPEAILAAHTRATLQRVREHPLVLCAQDTTYLNYSTHPRTEGLGPIGNNRDKTIGLLLHSTLALTPQGQALGMLHAQPSVRSKQRFGRCSTERNRLKVADKESQKWLDSHEACQQHAAQCPDTMLVNLADREGDLYELFAAALAPREGPRVHVLVRAQHNRQVAHPQHYLWDALAAQGVSARLQVKVPRQKNGPPARVAILSVRFAQVTLLAPCLKEHQPCLTLWAVEARETRPPRGVEPVCWRLLTTLPVRTVDEALEKVRWYAQRWQIEIIHKILKSGCRLEQRQLGSAARLRRVAMVDLIVAWRVLGLTKAARATPEAPASDWLDQHEWRALCCYFEKCSQPPATPPPLRQAVRWIAQLGGFLARRRDGEPGPVVLWRGLQQLRAITAAWVRFGHASCG